MDKKQYSGYDSVELPARGRPKKKVEQNFQNIFMPIDDSRRRFSQNPSMTGFPNMDKSNNGGYFGFQSDLNGLESFDKGFNTHFNQTTPTHSNLGDSGQNNMSGILNSRNRTNSQSNVYDKNNQQNATGSAGSVFRSPDFHGNAYFNMPNVSNNSIQLDSNTQLNNAFSFDEGLFYSQNPDQNMNNISNTLFAQSQSTHNPQKNTSGLLGSALKGSNNSFLCEQNFQRNNLAQVIRNKNNIQNRALNQTSMGNENILTNNSSTPSNSGDSNFHTNSDLKNFQDSENKQDKFICDGIQNYDIQNNHLNIDNDSNMFNANETFSQINDENGFRENDHGKGFLEYNTPPVFHNTPQDEINFEHNENNSLKGAFGSNTDTMQINKDSISQNIPENYNINNVNHISTNNSQIFDGSFTIDQKNTDLFSKNTVSKTLQNQNTDNFWHKSSFQGKCPSVNHSQMFQNKSSNNVGIENNFKQENGTINTQMFSNQESSFESANMTFESDNQNNFGSQTLGDGGSNSVFDQENQINFESQTFGNAQPSGVGRPNIVFDQENQNNFESQSFGNAQPSGVGRPNMTFDQENQNHFGSQTFGNTQPLGVGRSNLTFGQESQNNFGSQPSGVGRTNGHFDYESQNLNNFGSSMFKNAGPPAVGRPKSHFKQGIHNTNSFCHKISQNTDPRGLGGPKTHFNQGTPAFNNLSTFDSQNTAIQGKTGSIMNIDPRNTHNQSFFDPNHSQNFDFQNNFLDDEQQLSMPNIDFGDSQTFNTHGMFSNHQKNEFRSPNSEFSFHPNTTNNFDLHQNNSSIQNLNQFNPNSPAVHPCALPNDLFMTGNPWLNRKKRKSNPLVWQYMQQHKEMHPGLVHPSRYSSYDYVKMDRSHKMFIGTVKRQQSFPDKNIPNYTVLPLFLNATSFYENQMQSHEFEKIARIFLKKTESIDYENVTVQQLKSIMKEFGLNHTGKKIDLIERVKQSIETLHKKLEESGNTPQKENHENTPTLPLHENYESTKQPPSLLFDSSKNNTAMQEKKTIFNGQSSTIDFNTQTTMPYEDPNSLDYLFF